MSIVTAVLALQRVGNRVHPWGWQRGSFGAANFQAVASSEAGPVSTCSQAPAAGADANDGQRRYVHDASDVVHIHFQVNVVRTHFKFFNAQVKTNCRKKKLFMSFEENRQITFAIREWYIGSVDF